MVDIFSPQKRSAVMTSIRGRGNKSTELALATLLRKARITGWRRHAELHPKPCDDNAKHLRLTKSGRLRVRPDFVFRARRVALFVDGCFWHKCPEHSTTPQQNAEFWNRKLDANARRDAAHTKALREAGWEVVRIWEHELSDGNSIAQRVIRALTR